MNQPVKVLLGVILVFGMAAGASGQDVLPGVPAALPSAPAVGAAAPAGLSQSAAAAAGLTALLDQRGLDAIAAPDPDNPGQFVAALYFPGAQLLVVSSPYAAPALLDKRIAEAAYMDVYVTIQSAATHAGQFFVMDLEANGLQPACLPDQPFDSTSRDGATYVAFDGKWDAQRLTEAEYRARFGGDDARYARMLGVLAESITNPRPRPVGPRKGSTN